MGGNNANSASCSERNQTRTIVAFGRVIYFLLHIPTYIDWRAGLRSNMGTGQDQLSGYAEEVSWEQD